MDSNLKQLREATNKGLVPESYMAQYMQHMHDLEYSALATELLPPAPSIEQLTYGG